MEKKRDSLPEATKIEEHAKMVENVVQELGKDAFELLDAHEKGFLRLFIWAGCGCHKDLNTVQGGCYDSLSLPQLHFISIGYTFPILFKSPFSISINKLFYFQPFYYSAFYYSAFHYSALYYSAFSLFSSITQQHFY